MKGLRAAILSLGVALGLVALPLATADVAYAVDPKTQICKGVQGAGGGTCSGAELNTQIKDIVNILLFIVGAAAVIMIVIGGLRYILTQGDQSSIQSAKNTVLYSVIGLIVALLAYAIVNFVVGSF